MNYFLMVSNPLDTTAKEVTEAVNSIPSIGHWMRFFDNAFIIRTTTSAHVLTGQISVLMPGKQFMLVECDWDQANGMLPPQSWRMIDTLRSFDHVVE